MRGSWCFPCLTTPRAHLKQQSTLPWMNGHSGGGYPWNQRRVGHRATTIACRVRCQCSLQGKMGLWWYHLAIRLLTLLLWLNEYFDHLGVKTISKLAKGTRVPYVQIYVRAISKSVIAPSLSALKSRQTNPPKPHHHPVQSTNSSPTSTKAHARPKPDPSYTMPPIHSSSLHSINHPSFTQVSPTIYLVKQPNYPIQLSIYVAHIAEYIQFNKQICEDDNTSHYQSVPIGFFNFCNAWNSGVASDDPHCLSTFYYTNEPTHNFPFSLPHWTSWILHYPNSNWHNPFQCQPNVQLFTGQH